MNPEEFWKPFEVEINDFDGLLTVINQVMEKAVEKILNLLGVDKLMQVGRFIARYIEE